MCKGVVHCLYTKGLNNILNIGCFQMSIHRNLVWVSPLHYSKYARKDTGGQQKLLHLLQMQFISLLLKGTRTILPLQWCKLFFFLMLCTATVSWSQIIYFGRNSPKALHSLVLKVQCWQWRVLLISDNLFFKSHSNPFPSVPVAQSNKCFYSARKQ